MSMRRLRPWWFVFVIVLALALVVAALSPTCIVAAVVDLGPIPATEQNVQGDRLPLATDHGFLSTQEDGPCLTASQRAAIVADLAASRAALQAAGVLPPVFDRTQTVTLQWPLQAAPWVMDPGVHGISNYVDHDPSYPDQLLDYACGARTYDQANGYNHAGTDYFMWPFPWHKMIDQDVAIVAAAPGFIILKYDGNFDRSCGLNGGLWNAVYVQHADGSVAWYGHMKAGSLTSKPVGSTVEAGEYLGSVGSSGNSTGPHLHLELHDGSGNLVDPYLGPCNALDGESRWAQQRPYDDSAINALRTHDAPPEWPDCPEPAITHEQDRFLAGDLVYFAAYYRDQLAGQLTQFAVLRPDGSTWRAWSGGMSSPDHYAASYWWWNWVLPPTGPDGWWTFRATFEGQTVEHRFAVGESTPVPDTSPAGLTLAAPHPNPANPRTEVRYTLPAPGAVWLSVYDVRGRRLRELTLGVQVPGDHAVTWDGCDAAGRDLPSGTYLLRLQTEAGSLTRKVQLAR